MKRPEVLGSTPAGRPDLVLMVVTAILVTVGLVAVYSSSFVIGLADYGDANYFIRRQAVWAVVGGCLFLAALNTDYRVYRHLAVPLMAVTIIALVAVLVVGIEVNGAQRWLGYAGFTVQPAEFAKFAVIVYLAAWLASKGHTIRSFENGLVPFVVIISGVGVLILLEPDLGTTFVIVVVTVTMFWGAGASILQMLTLGAAGSIVLSFVALTEGYRLERIQAFLNAESDPAGNGFQTLQALIALGNGGIEGLGLGASRGKFFYIPGSHTDGIFAIIGEELGIVATLSVLALYVILMVRGYQIAMRARDPFGSLMAVGITTWIAAQALINMGGITRVIPLTGIPLPFISFGGSALASALLGAGVLAAISRTAERTADVPEAEPARREERGTIVRRRRKVAP